MKIVLSSGHGKFVTGAVGIINEVTEARRVVASVAGYLRQAGISVTEYHDDTSRIQKDNINGIVAFHNRQSRDLDVSVHFNAYKRSEAPKGVEVLYYTESVLAAKVSKAISDVSGLINRGAKKRTDLGFLSRTNKPAILIEVCFVDSTADVKLYQGKFDNICRAIAEAISGKKLSDVSASTDNTSNLPLHSTEVYVISPTKITALQALKWAESKGASGTFLVLASDYWALAESHGGVNPALAYAQAAYETGYGKFGGVLDEGYCNPCGLKTAAGGGDTDKSAHKRFTSWEEGLKAHLDHLALYAGAKGCPRADSPDPRHFPYLFGSGKTVEAMAKSWCPSNPQYASVIIRMMGEMAKITVSDTKSGENKNGYTNNCTADKTVILFSGKEVEVERILFNGVNYIKLRELEKLGISVGYDSVNNMPVLTC